MAGGTWVDENLKDKDQENMSLHDVEWTAGNTREVVEIYPSHHTGDFKRCIPVHFDEWSPR